MGKLGNQGGFGNVIVRDQSTPIIDLAMTRQLGLVTLSAALTLGDLTFEIDSPSATPAPGNILTLKDITGVDFYQGEITSATPTTGDKHDVVMDTPMDFAYLTEDLGSLGSREMNVDGSSTPVVFTVSPVGLNAGTEWDITLMTFILLDSSAMDDGKFGGLDKLTNGFVIRSDNGNNKNVMNVKTNGEFAESAFDRVYSDKAPAGQFSILIKRTISGKENSGVVLRIEASTDDGIKCIVQDDLTGLDVFRVRVQGHVRETL